jgi:hypothetical protein
MKIKTLVITVAVLGALTAIGQSVSGSNAKPQALPSANVSKVVEQKMYQDCTTRGSVSLPRGTNAGQAWNYVDENKHINVHVRLNDALGNEIKDVRCVYTPDGAMFIRGAQ